MKKIFRYIGLTLSGLIGIVVAYCLLSLILSMIPVNKDVPPGEDVEVFLITNGVHADLVLPVRHPRKDWSRDVRFDHTRSNDSSASYIAFGWGDRGFYLETPTWADLKFGTAVEAAFGLGRTAMHTTFYKRMTENDQCRKISMSHSQYDRLVSYIEQSFQRSADGSFMVIETDANYGNHDAFYEAGGSYSLFKTCNTWVNNGLKAAGLRACLWTPSDAGIFFQYPQDKPSGR